MTNPTGYWCPVCGDLKETASPFPWLEGAAYRHVDCGVHGDQIIPVYTPLAVPEETTWGESGGDEAITLHHHEPETSPWWMLGTKHARVVDNYASAWWMTGRSLKTGDIVEAMNFLVAGAK